MTKSIQFSYNNWSDAATLSGGSWLAALPLVNLQNRLQSLVARSTDATAPATQFAIDLGNTSTIVSIIGLVRHNFSTAATYRITGGTTPGGSDIFDTGTLAVWPPIYLPGDLEWEMNNWWTGIVDPAVAALYPVNLWVFTGGMTLARYWTVIIVDTTNTAGYVQIGRLWMGQSWQPQRSFAWNATLGWEARSIEEQSLGGVLYFDQRPSARIFDLQMNAMTNVDGFGNALDMQRIVRNDGEIVVIPDSDDIQRGFKRNILGRLRKMDPIKQVSLGLHTTGYEVEELL
jgi:hypothetical protein